MSDSFPLLRQAIIRGKHSSFLAESSMSSPLDAFFIGRALAEAVYEQTEQVLTETLSELGKFDAEQRERLRQFTEGVLARAQREADAAKQAQTTTAIVPIGTQPADLQATIDELRAEIAQLRSELKRYRSNSLT
jgi:polyhydroxyalkanoate synthesis regulator phasin